MPSRYTLPHIDIGARAEAQPYQGQQAGGGGPDTRERTEHGRRLQAELAAALQLAEQLRTVDARLAPPEGTYLEVELRRGTAPDALDRKRDGVRTGAARVEPNGDRKIALYVPDASRAVLERIINDYLNTPTEPDTNPPNKAKVEAIEAFRAARLETFWTDDPAALPPDANSVMWWALWCWNDGEGEIIDVCGRLSLQVASADRWLRFPEALVIPVYASRAAIELMLFATRAIAELRRASDTPSFYFDDVRQDQEAWVGDLAERTVWPASDAPAVCLFDTGVNRGHPLLEPALATADMHALVSDWGVDDHDEKGHGSGMAGLAAHGDLTAALSDRGERTLIHRLESVKLLPPDAFDATDPRSYGSVTQSAIALPEIAAPGRKRVFCMAITNENVSGKMATAWSAAVDQAANGSMTGDEADAPKRLILVSGGNIPAHINASDIRPQDDYPIEDPAQAWNALTIGGYTELSSITEESLTGWTPFADVGGVSPHSRTSVSWPQSVAPFKPELVLEAGNRAISPSRREVLSVGSLSLLTTGNDANARLVPFDATSAATAQAARMAARLVADHPDFWPETIRGLMVHSAEWTPKMRAEFGDRPSLKDRYELVRRYGYGVPDFDRATASAQNELAMIAQAEIRPFKREGRKFGDCHYYNLPLPRRVLEDLANEEVELKITLSYFVDPNPGLSANVDPYRYQSHGFRFDLQRKRERLEIFKQRVNPSEREDPRRAPPSEADDNRWMLGPNSVSSGSLHCDVWTGPAIELVGRDTLCVKPVMGWCRNRASLNICNMKRRYALIVTLKARGVDVDLYTPIKAIVDIPTSVSVDTVRDIFG